MLRVLAGHLRWLLRETQVRVRPAEAVTRDKVSELKARPLVKRHVAMPRTVGLVSYVRPT